MITVSYIQIQIQIKIYTIILPVFKLYAATIIILMLYLQTLFWGIS